MESKEISKGLSELVTAMLGKGLARPDASIVWPANSDLTILLSQARPGNNYAEDTFHYAKGKTIAVAFESARDCVDNLPSPEKARMQRFMKSLAGTIETGRECGIEVEFLTPLQETMKTLSNNILTDQRAA
ncbi:hypothetical protein [Pararhizobium antarcticum]|uniref:Uncharacterized protein n=1 Tax=Pararhizobium antarcticum TaxID=1798805 RepID=A0A657LU94_9HYPH|nr:hypothetical protein [Pararhizobium antarcticum]OJF97607.1 hypothetical protein AX760_16740 [Pararhizobium antarcticum]